MTGFIEKFEVYIQHIRNVISDTSKHCDKATLEGREQTLKLKCWNKKSKLKCSCFIDILDSAKNNNIDIILLVERIDGMKLPYQLFANKFQASLESVFWATTCEKTVDSSRA